MHVAFFWNVSMCANGQLCPSIAPQSSEKGSMGEHYLRDSVICASLCGRWRPPSVPDSPIRHGSDPSLSCPASPGRHRVALAGVQGLFLLFFCLHILCASGQTWLGRINPQVWECGLCYPPLGEGVVSSLDWCLGRTVPAQAGGTHALSPSGSSSLLSLDGCHRAAEQQWQQPDGAAGGQLGHLTQRQE